MRLKATIAAFVLALVPAAGFADCNWNKMNTTANTCAEGTVYDPASGTCVTQATS
jgi:hypothetical protein